MDDALPADACFRCGYDLRGIADDSPCPECGLLAGRSRMPSDELRHARPRWLRTLSVGTWLTLVAWAGVAAAFWLFGNNPYEQAWALYGSTAGELQTLPLPITLVGAAAAAGVWLLTGSEGRGGARGEGRGAIGLRVTLRLLVLIPLAGALYLHLMLWRSTASFWILEGQFEAAVPLVVVAAASLPLLGFLRLRGLARRVLDPSLAEHCAIVGLGMTLGIVLPAALLAADLYAGGLILKALRDDGGWSFDLLVMAVAVANLLFYLWAGLLLARFALAFARAGRAAKRAWAQADAAATIQPSD